jgi:hypothetical protein
MREYINIVESNTYPIKGGTVQVVTRELRGNRYSFTATVDGQRAAIGEFQAQDSMNGDKGSVEEITVAAAFRRRGIASAIYSHFEKMGFTVVPSDDVRPDGQAFWKSRPLTELSRPVFIDEVDPILKKAGWTRVGSGYYASVYAKEGVNYVLKLFSNHDKGYIDFLKLVQQHPNKHFPTLRGLPRRITSGYTAVRMEKLLPAGYGDDVPSLGVYLLCRDTGPYAKNQYQVKAYEHVVEYLQSQPELKRALDLIIDNLLPKYNEDLHSENFMKRADGTLVIIDPVGFVRK